MFTGVVQGTGRVGCIDRSERGARVEIETAMAAELRAGDSVAVNGVCLTAAQADVRSFAAEAMNETLTRTVLVELAPGERVNLELPLRPTDRLGGHIVQGHVDGVGTVVAVREDGFARKLEIQASAALLRYVVPKGSIALDGVSLTVVEADVRSFTVSLIPETLERTNLGSAGPGTRMNLEADVLAKYLEKLTSGLQRSPAASEAISEAATE